MRILLYLFFALHFFHAFAQEKAKEVEIINADKLQFKTLEDGSSVRKLVGNVKLKHENTLMFCDSAYMYKETNTLDAFGNVHIIENDSIHAYSNLLKYNGNTKLARLIGNARLIDGDMKLTSEELDYDMQNKIGFYSKFGKVISDSTVLTSKRGFYYSNTKIAHFKDSVVVVDPDYLIESDTMHYNTKTRVADFFGPTTIYNDSSDIYCIRGTYDTANEIAKFGKNTIVNNPPQTLYADSLYYERANGYGKAFFFFDWRDEEMKAGMTGTLAEYFESNKKIIAYNRPILHVEMDDDTMFMSGNVVHSMENSEHGEKEFWAYPSARIFKSDLQGVCDSLFYSGYDSTFRMYREPILWNENTEMRGDTIYIYLANEKVDYIDFIENGFIASQSVGKIFDQIKGKYITGYFEEGKLSKLFANRNAESLYFGKDEEIENKVMGGNLVKSASLWMYMDEGEVDRIVFIDKPEALFTPISQMTNAQLYLGGFYWNGAIRPKSKYDL
jgi:lipopolysaccharide export system protein LptA